MGVILFKMIDKLSKDDRLEFLVKTGLVENRFNISRAVNASLAIIGLIMIISNENIVGWLALILFAIFSICDAITMVKNKKQLFNEYFEIKPRSKK